MRTGGNIAKATMATRATNGGAIFLGKRFVITNKFTLLYIKVLKSSFAAAPRKLYLNRINQQSKFAKYGDMPTRIATMLIGMIKDLTTGGNVGIQRI